MRTRIKARTRTGTVTWTKARTCEMKYIPLARLHKDKSQILHVTKIPAAVLHKHDIVNVGVEVKGR